MESLLPHIEDGVKEGRVVLEIHDVELSDFVEDYLTENCELTPEASTNRNGSVVFYFDAKIPLKKVREALMKLSPSEIESIYRINHPC